MRAETAKKPSFRERFKASFEKLDKGESFKLDVPVNKSIRPEQVHRIYTPERPAFHSRNFSDEELLLRRCNAPAAKKLPVLRPMLLKQQAKPVTRGWIGSHLQPQGSAVPVALSLLPVKHSGISSARLPLPPRRHKYLSGSSSSLI